MAAAEPNVESGGATAVGHDRITLTGITGYGHHGVFDFEREQGQPFVVDLTCQLDLSARRRQRRPGADHRLRQPGPARSSPTSSGTH